jgi:acetyl-CoA carboxylase carboxyl transferase subunit alpha
MPAKNSNLAEVAAPKPAKERKEHVPHKDKENKDKEHKEKAPNETWEHVLLARHVQRPHALDFIRALFEDFVEVHGDRRFGDDGALVGGPARFEGQTVMVMGQQKGRDTKENIFRNFGSPRPEGYRKALRLMQHAEKFGMPVLTLIDTGGAFPGKESEERGMAMAIAENLLVLAQLRVPVIALVTGEGGSGGALAIGLADRVLMLENSVYSVASPEASAAILWRDAVHAPAAAAAMKITAPDLLKFGLIDEIVPEPEGGAHQDPPALFASVREAFSRHLHELQTRFIRSDSAALRRMIEERRAKYRRMGQWQELSELELAAQLTTAKAAE